MDVPFYLRIERLDAFHEILEWNVLGAEGCLVNLRGWWSRAYAAEVKGLYAESVASAEYAAHVVHRADVVEYYHKRCLARLAELFYRQTLHLDGSEFSVVCHIGCKSTKKKRDGET